jgi:hypothetical protein
VCCLWTLLPYGAASGGAELASSNQPKNRLLAQGGLRRSGRTASVHWDQVPLRDAMARASNVFRESAFIDRRVDPTQRVSLHTEGASFDELLQTLAASLSLGSSRLGDLRYLGPLAAAEQLRTVAAVRGDEASKLPAALQTSLGRAERLTWPRLTEPRALVAAFAQQRGWRIAQGERIPHDLWPANSLPALSAVEQLTVLLIGFDLTFKANPGTRTLDIVPLEPVTIQRRYPLSARQRNQLHLLQGSDANAVRVEGRWLVVEGRIEEYERVLALLGERPSPQPAKQPIKPTKQVYTLRVQEQPVGIVLKQLTERLGWAIEIDETAIRAADLSLDTRVSFAVENSSQDVLLDAVLHPAGLDYRREVERIRIVPREK